MKNFECSNSVDRRRDKRRLLFLKLFLLVLFFLLAFAGKVFSQSLESQLKIISGDLLQGSKYKEARILGKALSISGNMQSNMEMINAQNKQELTINLPPNTYMSQNNQIIPNQGYQWINPNNASDLRVMPVGVSNATLSPYDLNYIEETFIRFPKMSLSSNTFSTLKTLFAYNWFSDMNGDGSSSFNEFQNIKRTFQLGEPVEFAFTFVAKCGSSPRRDMADNLSFLIQVFDNATGNLIAKEQFPFHESEGDVEYRIKIKRNPLGNLPPGKYLISVSMTSSQAMYNRAVVSLTDYIEVI